MHYKIIAAIIALAAAYYAGVKSVDQTEIKAEVAKVVDKDIKEVTTTTKNKDGSVVIVKTKDTSVKSQSVTKTETKSGQPDKTTVQLLYGTELTQVDEHRTKHYGIAISKKIAGPVVGGLFILGNGKSTSIGGISLGLEF